LASNQGPPFPSLDPLELLELAKELATTSTAATIRTAGDRAYQAAYLFSRDDLSAKDHFTPQGSGDDHSNLVIALRRSHVLGTFGDYLDQLRRARNVLNYVTGAIEPSHPDVRPIQWMIDRASEIIEKVTDVPHR